MWRGGLEVFVTGAVEPLVCGGGEDRDLGGKELSDI